MPRLPDKVLIDCQRIDAEMVIAATLAEELRDMGLLTTPESVDFEERLGALCKPFLDGVRQLNDDLGEFVNKHFVDKKQE